MKLFLLLSATIALTACDSPKSNHGMLLKNEHETLQSQNNSGVTGRWALTNAPQKNMSVEITFNDNGTFRMYGKEDIYDAASRVKDISGSWTMKGDNIYISTPGESEVGVMEILSLDANSLVIHIKGEPENEIMYLNKLR